MKLLTIYEHLLKEVSDESYNMIKANYPNHRITMGNREGSDVAIRNTEQKNSGNKPSGLWYSFGTKWIDWVRSEMSEWERDGVYVIEIDESNILRINTKEELIRFNSFFGQSDGFSIDWRQVSRRYSGIEIDPVQYVLREEYHWYYPWDVPSGCIWKDNAVKNITKIGL